MDLFGGLFPRPLRGAWCVERVNIIMFSDIVSAFLSDVSFCVVIRTHKEGKGFPDSKLPAEMRKRVF
jgi:hypothetical protein